ncbi:MAG: DUF4843 domain-containing protein [Rikenellaceae bacterium]|nr:DUF4843 domain-containing protein [Rikenellaceae bacterium]
MKKLFILTMIIGLAFVSCSKESVPFYDVDNSHFVMFDTDIEDTVEFTFMFHPEVEIGKAFEQAIPVSIMGQASDRDREFKIEAFELNNEAGTLNFAKAGTHFELPEKCVIRAGQFQDTIYVKFFRREDMKTTNYFFAIKIVENNEFKPGQEAYCVNCFYISDKIAKPAWWSTFQSTYLGTYSDKKFELLIKVTGQSDWENFSAGEARYYAVMFKRWLATEKAAGRTVYEEADEAGNAKEMTVNVLG